MERYYKSRQRAKSLSVCGAPRPKSNSEGRLNMLLAQHMKVKGCQPQVKTQSLSSQTDDVSVSPNKDIVWQVMVELDNGQLGQYNRVSGLISSAAETARYELADPSSEQVLELSLSAYHIVYYTQPIWCYGEEKGRIAIDDLQFLPSAKRPSLRVVGWSNESLWMCEGVVFVPLYLIRVKPVQVLSVNNG